MSSVRLCDRCNSIFSENKEGWTSASGSRRIRNKNGEMITQTIALDYCPPCSDDAIGGNNLDEPRVPAVKGRYNDRYTRQLEKEAGIGANPVDGTIVDSPSGPYGTS
jgi:hypothetical protein